MANKKAKEEEVKKDVKPVEETKANDAAPDAAKGRSRRKGRGHRGSEG